MPGNGPETARATTYPTQRQYERWKRSADEFGMSVSEYIVYMTEAGQKKFDLSAADTDDETARELRRELADLREELASRRERVERLEERLHTGQRRVVREFVEANPDGVTYAEITQHVADRLPDLVANALDDLDADGAIRRESDLYYPASDTQTPGERP